jgi:hypothetical protein
MKRLASYTVLVLLVCCACGSGGTPQGSSAVRIAVEFVRSYASGALSVEAGTRLLGSTEPPRQTNEYWQLGTKDGTVELVIKARTLVETSEDAVLRLRPEAGVRLSDLEAVFGHWDLVSTGEFSSVSFRVDGKALPGSLAFARLSTPKPEPASLVTSIQMRRAPPASIR